MRTTVDLDKNLLRRLRVEARRRGVTVKALLARLLQRGLDASNEPPPKYRTPTFALGTPLPGVNLDNALGLAGALEDQETVAELKPRK